MLPPIAIAFVTLFLTLILFTVVWRIHVGLKDAGIVDYYWGTGFSVIAGVSLLLTPTVSGLSLLLSFAVLIWTLRLTLYLIRRHRGSTDEDPRYANMRKAVGPSFWWKSLFSVFWLQGLLQWIIASPIHMALLFPVDRILPVAAAAGFAVFVIGFVIESIADAQLARFRNNPTSSEKVMDTGLWAWSRHPNYCGESVVWWGLGLVGFAGSGSLWVFVGPAVLTLVLITISIPLTERHSRATRAGYAVYQARTSAFIPWPPHLR